LKDLISKVYFAVTDHFDVIQFKVVSQKDRGKIPGEVVEIETEIIGDFTDLMKSQHEFYFSKIFVRQEKIFIDPSLTAASRLNQLPHSIKTEFPVLVFKTLKAAKSKAIKLLNEKLDQIDQERQNILTKIENTRK
jgi:hypothetical protein